MPTVAEYIALCLRSSGITTAFGYPGHSSLRLIDAAKRAGLRYVQMADERSAGFAAAGFIDATGLPTVVIASKGPAATNLITSLTSAQRDGIPLLAIVGNVAKSLRGRGSFQEFDIVDAVTAGGTAKAALYIDDPAQVPEALTHLFATAWRKPWGPSLLDLPYSILDDEVAAEPRGIEVPREESVEDARVLGQIRRAAQHVLAASRPLVVVGRGAREDYMAVRHFVERHAIPVVHTMGGTGVIASNSDSYIGLLRHNGDPDAIEHTESADVILALGVGFDERATGAASQFATSAFKIHVDLDAGVLNRNVPVNLPIVAPIGAFVDALEAAFGAEQLQFGWHAKRQVVHRSGQAEDGALDVEELLGSLAEITSTAIVVKDSGAHKYWVTRYCGCQSPRQSIASCHFGSMGFALPAGVGAAIGRPDETVIVVCGDGGLLMSLPDLYTVMHEELTNLKIVVFNNAGLGSTRFYARHAGIDSTISDFPAHLPFALYAAAFGIPGVTLVNHRDLASLITGLGAPGPILIDCVLDPNQTVTPTVSYLAPLRELIAASYGSAVALRRASDLRSHSQQRDSPTER